MSRRGRENLKPTLHSAWSPIAGVGGAQSHDPETTTPAKTKCWLFNLLRHLGVSYFFLLKIYFFRERERERERESMTMRRGRGKGRERERQTPCWMRSPMWGLIRWPWNHPSQKSRVGHSTDWATQVSLTPILKQILLGLCPCSATSMFFCYL